MAVSVHQMLDFSDDLNERWFAWLRDQPGELLDHNFEFSFRSPLGILTHIGNIENGWMNVVEGKDPDWRNPRHSTKAFHDVGPVLDYLGETRTRTHKLIDGLDEKALQDTRTVDPTGVGKDTFTIEELAWIVFTHEQWHRGELIAAFWSRDVEPARLDWHQYLTPVGGL